MARLGSGRATSSSSTVGVVRADGFGDQQVDALAAVGVEPERVYSVRMSGKRDDRPGLAEMLKFAHEGDTVVVVALDRLGRSLPMVIRTIDDLQAAAFPACARCPPIVPARP